MSFSFYWWLWIIMDCGNWWSLQATVIIHESVWKISGYIYWVEQYMTEILTIHFLPYGRPTHSFLFNIDVPIALNFLLGFSYIAFCLYNFLSTYKFTHRLSEWKIYASNIYNVCVYTLKCINACIRFQFANFYTLGKTEN